MLSLFLLLHLVCAGAISPTHWKSDLDPGYYAVVLGHCSLLCHTYVMLLLFKSLNGQNTRHCRRWTAVPCQRLQSDFSQCVVSWFPYPTQFALKQQPVSRGRKNAMEARVCRDGQALRPKRRDSCRSVEKCNNHWQDRSSKCDET